MLLCCLLGWGFVRLRRGFGRCRGGCGGLLCRVARGRGVVVRTWCAERILREEESCLVLMRVFQDSAQEKET